MILTYVKQNTHFYRLNSGVHALIIDSYSAAAAAAAKCVSRRSNDCRSHCTHNAHNPTREQVFGCVAKVLFAQHTNCVTYRNVYIFGHTHKNIAPVSCIRLRPCLCCFCRRMYHICVHSSILFSHGQSAPTGSVRSSAVFQGQCEAARARAHNTTRLELKAHQHIERTTDGMDGNARALYNFYI